MTDNAERKLDGVGCHCTLLHAREGTSTPAFRNFTIYKFITI